MKRIRDSRAGSPRWPRSRSSSAPAPAVAGHDGPDRRARPRRRPRAHRPARRRARRPARRRARPPPSSQFKIGYSNGGGVGNGFREEQVCTAKAEALASGGKLGRPDRQAPQHRCGRPGFGHPRPDRGRRRTRSCSTRTIPRRSTRRSPRPHAAGIKTVSVDAFVTDPEHLQPVQQPDQVRRDRRQAGCSSSSAARATSGTPAASPATPPTPTATSASRTPSRTTRTSRSSRTRTACSPSGTRRPPPRSPTTSSPAASTTRSRASGRRAWASRSSTRSRRANKPFVPIADADVGGFVDAAPRPHGLPGPRRARP